MKRFLVIASVSFFVMCITAKDFTALAWQLWYQVNQEYVARELCVNKAKPEMHCNGKCHLMKQLRHLEEPTSQGAESNSGPKKQQSTTLKLKTFDWIPGTTSDFSPCTNFTDNETCKWPEPNQVIRAYSSFIFHPPSIA